MTSRPVGYEESSRRSEGSDEREVPHLQKKRRTLQIEFASASVPLHARQPCSATPTSDQTGAVDGREVQTLRRQGNSRRQRVSCLQLLTTRRHLPPNNDRGREAGFSFRPPSLRTGRDGRFSRIRLSSQWSPFEDWLATTLAVVIVNNPSFAKYSLIQS